MGIFSFLYASNKSIKEEVKTPAIDEKGAIALRGPIAESLGSGFLHSRYFMIVYLIAEISPCCSISSRLTLTALHLCCFIRSLTNKIFHISIIEIEM